jgi:integrase/recombinase XerD
MNPLREAVQDYLTLRRGLGFKLRETEYSLTEFVNFIDQRGVTRVTTAIALEWATSKPSTRPGSAADRLRRVRGFARHHLANDPTTEIPPVDLLPSHLCRRQPYLYSDDQIERLLSCTLTLPPSDGLRRWTYYCFLGLLSVTGLRLGEAIRLQVGDVDLDQGLLTIRQTKFGKSRLVAIDDSTSEQLACYRTRRDRFMRGLPKGHFFVSGNRTALNPSTIHRTFYRLLDQAEVHAYADGLRPRLHDLRHRFALQTLLRWYRTGEDVERRLPALSTYLGHVSIEHTYWYLSACPELMGHALTRLEQRWKDQP